MQILAGGVQIHAPFQRAQSFRCMWASISRGCHHSCPYLHFYETGANYVRRVVNGNTRMDSLRSSGKPTAPTKRVRPENGSHGWEAQCRTVVLRFLDRFEATWYKFLIQLLYLGIYLPHMKTFDRHATTILWWDLRCEI